MVSSINKDVVSEIKYSTEPIPIRFCPVCNEKPSLPMIYRGKIADYCWPDCFKLVLNAVTRNDLRTLKIIFGEEFFEF